MIKKVISERSERQSTLKMFLERETTNEAVATQEYFLIITLIPTAFKMSYFPQGGGAIWPALCNRSR